jgi:hypothetical protein
MSRADAAHGLRLDPEGVVSRARQSFAIELRIVRRFRDRANVNHALGTMRFEQADELRYRAG